MIFPTAVLAVALAECCIGGPEKPLGVRIQTREMIRADALLFSESQSRIIVSSKRKNRAGCRKSAPAQRSDAGDRRGRRHAL